MHAGLLAFLDTSYVTQPTRSIVRSPKNTPEDGYDFILDTVVRPLLEQTAEINCDWIKQETLEEKLGMILEERAVEDDEDRAFFSSLLPTIRSLDPDQKVEFRMEVLQALRQIATKQPTPPLILPPENSPVSSSGNGTFSGTFGISSPLFGTFGFNSGVFPSTTGSTPSSQQIQAAEDFIVSLRGDMQQECSSSSTSSSSSLPQLTSDTQ